MLFWRFWNKSFYLLFSPLYLFYVKTFAFPNTRSILGAMSTTEDPSVTPREVLQAVVQVLRMEAMETEQFEFSPQKLR